MAYLIVRCANRGSTGGRMGLVVVGVGIGVVAVVAAFLVDWLLESARGEPVEEMGDDGD